MGAATLIPAHDTNTWHSAMAHFGALDSTYLPEYHLAYHLRIAHSEPFLWHYSAGDHHLIYPFLRTPVMVGGTLTGDYDISGIYGYTGPIATTNDASFLQGAWQAFDAFTNEQRIIAEFIRFSPFNRNQACHHPDVSVEENRILAASYFPEDASAQSLLGLLGSKTRNMLRKAEREGLTARELSLPEWLRAFRALYDETMNRNGAPDFFYYDDAYYKHLLTLQNGLRLFGTFADDKLVAAAMSVSHGPSGLYHLGASLPEYARLGAGNLSVFSMSCGLMRSGVRFLNMTGGRTQSASDPLLLFKKSNATGTAPFYIGKRIVNAASYQRIRADWQAHTKSAPDEHKIIFWR